MGYVTSGQITLVREIDLLTYLQTCEPQELVHVGGRTALDYLIKVQGYSFIQAVEILSRRAAALPPVSRAPPQREPRKLVLPERSETSDRVKKYLMGRGIHPSIIDYCVEKKLLFESKQYHNAVFVGYDHSGQARYAALRGAKGSFKSEDTGSD